MLLVTEFGFIPLITSEVTAKSFKNTLFISNSNETAHCAGFSTNLKACLCPIVTSQIFVQDPSLTPKKPSEVTLLVATSIDNINAGLVKLLASWNFGPKVRTFNCSSTYSLRVPPFMHVAQIVVYTVLEGYQEWQRRSGEKHYLIDLVESVTFITVVLPRPSCRYSNKSVIEPTYALFNIAMKHCHTNYVGLLALPSLHQIKQASISKTHDLADTDQQQSSNTISYLLMSISFFNHTQNTMVTLPAAKSILPLIIFLSMYILSIQGGIVSPILVFDKTAFDSYHGTNFLR